MLFEKKPAYWLTRQLAVQSAPMFCEIKIPFDFMGVNGMEESKLMIMKSFKNSGKILLQVNWSFAIDTQQTGNILPVLFRELNT